MKFVSKTGMLALVVVMLGLYGCNQEQASDNKAEAPKTETSEEATTTETTVNSQTTQVVEEVATEVVEQVEEVVEQAEEVVQEVTEQAQEVVNEAVNEAEEVAEEVTEEVSSAASNATQDVQEQASEVASEAQEVTSEASENTSVTAQNPEAILSAPETLQADTLEAARHDRSQSKIAYVGAWASDANGCSLIDQDVYDGFAVVTPNSIRMFEELCTIKGAQMIANPTVLEASCSAEGETNQSKITIEMLNGENMKLAHEGTSGFELVRCYLPQ